MLTEMEANVTQTKCMSKLKGYYRREREEEIKRKAKEDRDKELKVIEERIAKKYETKFAEEARKLENTQHELNQLIQKQKQNDSQVLLLKEQVKGYEK